MSNLERMETFRNFFDLGYLRQTFKHAVREKIDMGIKDFLGYLFFGSGYTHWTPPQLERRLKGTPGLAIIDLRPSTRFKKGHIFGARSCPFDEFMKTILMDDKDTPPKHEQIILVCDTGHKSRVAASVLSENGYRHPISLNRGMYRFNRWQTLKAAKSSSGRCCSLFG